MGRIDIDITLARRAFELHVELNLGAETLALIGPSGAGKTSLLRCVAGLERPNAGRITIGDEAWFDAVRGRHLSPEHRRVGYMPQDYGLFPHLTVAGNIRFAAGRERPDLLERFGLAALARARPGELSGGERQRVAVARAVGREPRVLLLDEPFGALDAITRRQVRDQLGQTIHDLELPTLLVTHAFDDASALAARIGVIDAGRLVQLGGASELITRPATALVAELTGANVVSGQARRQGTGALVTLVGGGELASAQVGDGDLEVALHPWDLELIAPDHAQLTDRVISAHLERGALIVLTDRFRVQIGIDGVRAPAPGQLVGLRAAPSRVRLLPRR